MITKILSSNQTNTGLIGIDGRNADSKRELYISDIPTDRNTIVFRLQNVHTHTITLDKTNGIDILFPKGLFDDVSKLNITNCEVSKWKVNANEDLINSSTLETDVKKTVEQFQRLKFIKIEEEIDKTPINQKEGLDNEIKELLKGYITDSLKIKQAVKELFEGYLENKPSQAFGDFSIVGQLYNNLNKLNEQIEGNISKLILLKSNFQQQRNLINTFVDKTVKNAITSELKKLSEKNIFEDPQNSNGAILALTKLVDIINKLKLHPNLVNLLSEHKREESDWKITTSFDNSTKQQKVKVTSSNVAFLTLKPKEYLVVEISNFEISRTAKNGNFLIKYDGATTTSGRFNKFSQDVAFSIIKRVGKFLPLHIELNQDSRIINDGKTVNELLFRVTNIGLKGLLIPLSSIEIRFDLQQQDGIYPKALIEGDRLNDVIINVTDADFSIDERAVINGTQTKNAHIVWKQTKKYQLAPNKQFLIKISNIVTNLPSGNIPIILVLRNMEGYKDRFYNINIKRALAKIFLKTVKLDNFSKVVNTKYKYEQPLTDIHKSKEYYLTQYDIEGKQPLKLAIKPFGAVWKIIAETTKDIKSFRNSTLNLQFVHYLMTNNVPKNPKYGLTYLPAYNMNSHRVRFINKLQEDLYITPKIKVKLQFESQTNYDYFKSNLQSLKMEFVHGTTYPHHTYDDANKTVIFSREENIRLTNHFDLFFILKNGISSQKRMYAQMSINFNHEIEGESLFLEQTRILVFKEIKV